MELLISFAITFLCAVILLVFLTLALMLYKGASSGTAPRRLQMIPSFRYAYRKARSWHGSVPASIVAGVRYSLTGDSGDFKSHGGWRMSRLHRGSNVEE